MRLIDADAFLKRNEVYADCEFIHPMYQNTLREIVDDEPTIDAVPVRHGEWIYHNYEDGNWCCTCSNCGKGDLHAIKGTVPYCWNCGARMDGGKDDNTQNTR